MLASPKMKLVEELVAGSSKEELIWLNGYLAGLLAINPKSEEAVAQNITVQKITLAYGTETGNAKKLATDLAVKLKQKGVTAKLVNLEQYRLTDLQKETHFFVIISTQGEGEPPAGAKKFYDFIHGNGVALKNLKYSVLALGDTSYPLFCKAGEDVDTQLQKLGGERLVPVQKCDTDYAPDAEAWLQTVLQALSGQQAAAAPTTIAKKTTGKKTYTGTVLTNINLNDRGSNKQTHHIEIAAEGVSYNPGDALGLIPRNTAATVEAIIELLGVQKGQETLYKNESYSLFDLLQQKLNITCLPERVVQKYAALVQQEIPVTKISLLDLLKIYPLKETTQVDELIALLEPIAPRLYSISSSPEAHADEVHITVAKDTFKINEDVKYGLCSDYLCGFELDKTFDFYIHKNGQFTLPAEDKDIIMIGPGTGIAPFRSFLAHRATTGAPGRNWLFFGDQHFVTDFLYQTELQDWVQTGVLTKLVVAFSRDGKDKVYVQHKMKKQQQEFYNWLQNGAYLYVCGSKEPMSVDVENTLLQIVQDAGVKTVSEAEAYVAQLKEEGRYLKDVY